MNIKSDNHVNIQRNGTSWSDGDLLMETGTADVNQLGKIVSWNNQDRTEAYQGVSFKKLFNMYTIYTHYHEEGCIGLYILDDQNFSPGQS